MTKQPTSRHTATIFMVFLFFTSVSSADTFRVMLHTGSFPPYFFEEDDTRTGIIRDVFTAITKETGDSVEYVRVPFKRSLRYFENGEIDIEPMTNPAWRKSSQVKGSYSSPYSVAEEAIIFRKAHAIAVDSPEDLLGKTIGVIKGYYYPNYEPYFTNGRIKASRQRNENKLIKLLLAGRLDQVIISKDFAQYKIKTQGFSDQLVVGDSTSVIEQMIRFHPSKEHALPRFNKAINKLLKNGVLESIYERYR